MAAYFAELAQYIRGGWCLIGGGGASHLRTARYLTRHMTSKEKFAPPDGSFPCASFYHNDTTVVKIKISQWHWVVAHLSSLNRPEYMASEGKKCNPDREMGVTNTNTYRAHGHKNESTIDPVRASAKQVLSESDHIHLV